MRFASAVFIVLSSVVPCGTGCVVHSYCDDHPEASQCSPQFTDPGGGGTSACDQPPSATPVELSLSYRTQPCTQLCWASSIAMVAQFFGRPVSECQLASEKYYLASGGYSYNCCNAYACNDPNCNVPAYVQEVSNILSYGLNLHGTFLQRPLNELELQEEIANNRPIIVFYQGAQSGHFAVVSGYYPGSPAMYHVDDPWPTFGSFNATYATIRLGPGGNENWYATHYQLRTTANLCQ